MSAENPTLSRAELNTLADQLIACISVEEQQSRDQIVRSLPSHIRSRIRRSNTTQLDVLAILETCNTFPEGVTQLIEAVRSVEGPTKAMQAVDSTFQKYATSTAAASQPANAHPTAPQPTDSGSTGPTVNPPTNSTASSPVNDAKQLKIFISYAREDQKPVRELYDKLINDGFAPWFDTEDVLPGQDWRLEIRRAVRNSHIVLACLSKTSVSRAAVSQQEIKMALDIADQQPEGSIFVIPIRLDDCQVPDRLSHLSWMNLFGDGDYKTLVRALRLREKQLGTA